MEGHYFDQANLCADQAASTTLPYVLDRCRRFEAAWLAMAERAARHRQIKAAVRA